jgi:hypothetical protein
VAGKGWVAAGDLIVGDEVHTLDSDAGAVTVTGLQLEKPDKPIPVYNLEVEDFQSYFVGGGVLVHNAYKPALNNKRLLQDTKIKGYTMSIDLEMGGSGIPNIHLKLDNVKYLWDENAKAFLSTLDGSKLPKSIRDLDVIKNALSKALQLLQGKWGQP